MKVKFSRGLEENLPKHSEEGHLLFTTNTRRIFEGNGIAQPLSEYSNVLSNYNDLNDLIEKNPRIKGKIYITNDNKAYIYNSGYIEIGAVRDLPYEYYEKVFTLNDTQGQVLKIIDYNLLIRDLNLRSIIKAEITLRNDDKVDMLNLQVLDNNIEVLNINIEPLIAQKYLLGIGQNTKIYVNGKFSGNFYMNYYQNTIN